MNLVQLQILQALEGVLQVNGAFAAHSMLHVINLTDSLPHPVCIEWTGIVSMAYDAEQARFDDRRAAELNYIIEGVAA